MESTRTPDLRRRRLSSPAQLPSARANGSADAATGVPAGRVMEHFAREGTERLYSIFRRAVGDDQIAEDLVQDTLHDAWRNIDRYDESRPFRHWIVRIGLNRLRSHLRRLRLERRWIAPLAVEPGFESPPADALVGREEKAALDRAIESLPEKQRAAVLLRYREGLSCGEIASALGVTSNAVSIQLHRARQTLRRRVGVADATGERATDR